MFASKKETGKQNVKHFLQIAKSVSLYEVKPTKVGSIIFEKVLTICIQDVPNTMLQDFHLETARKIKIAMWYLKDIFFPQNFENLRNNDVNFIYILKFLYYLKVTKSCFVNYLYIQLRLKKLMAFEIKIVLI